MHEISSFWEVLYKRNVLKNFSKFADNLKTQLCGSVPSKDILKNIAKFTKTSSRCPAQDKNIRPGHMPSRPLQDVFKTFSRRLQDLLPRRIEDVLQQGLLDIFKTSYYHVFKTSSKGLQDVLQKHLQDIFKMSSRHFKTPCKDAFKTFWRRIIRLNCFPRSRSCLG